VSTDAPSTDRTGLIVETVTDPALAPQVAEVAAATFPLACPAHSSAEDIAAHIATQLGPDDFAGWIASPGHDVLIARDGDDGPLLGYSLLIYGAPTDAAVAAAIDGDTAGSDTVTEISKMYVLPDHHAAHRDDRPSHRLMEAAIEAARSNGSTMVWLGVNQENLRAQRYYRKMGFSTIGTKTFDMNGTIEHDFVLGRRL